MTIQEPNQVGGKTQIEPENPCVTGPYAALISTRLVPVQMLFRSETILPYAASATQTLSLPDRLAW
jgi:hypothetical protein